MSTIPPRKPALRHFGGCPGCALDYVVKKLIENPFFSPLHFQKNWGIPKSLSLQWQGLGYVKFKSVEELNRHRIEGQVKYNTAIFPLSPSFKPREKK